MVKAIIRPWDPSVIFRPSRSSQLILLMYCLGPIVPRGDISVAQLDWNPRCLGAATRRARCGSLRKFRMRKEQLSESLIWLGYLKTSALLVSTPSKSDCPMKLSPLVAEILPNDSRAELRSPRITSLGVEGFEVAAQILEIMNRLAVSKLYSLLLTLCARATACNAALVASEIVLKT